jgi:MFS family permease
MAHPHPEASEPACMNREPISRPPLGATVRPQFHLRTLLLAIAVISALFALLQAVGLYSFLVLVFFLGLIACHVIGNALGTRLRDEARRLAQVEGAAPDPPPTTGALPAKPPASQLTENRKLPRGLLGFTTAGAVLGGIVGGALITAVTWQHITVAGIALGVGSMAVLGGFAGFLASSFYMVAHGALREALREPPREYKPR